jgi:hypothetical protein
MKGQEDPGQEDIQDQDLEVKIEEEGIIVPVLVLDLDLDLTLEDILEGVDREVQAEIEDIEVDREAGVVAVIEEDIVAEVKCIYQANNNNKMAMKSL